MAVAGGTGTVGRHVVDVARADRHEVVVLSRAAGVGLSDEARVAAALSDVDVVVDVVSTPLPGLGAIAGWWARPSATASLGRLRQLCEAEAPG